ncbi:MAG: hypothetical protein WCS64_00290 [Dehalococcoidales bacterium]
MVGAPGREVVNTGVVVFIGVVAGVSDWQLERGTDTRIIPRATTVV